MKRYGLLAWMLLLTASVVSAETDVVHVKSGETLKAIFQRNKIPNTDLYAIYAMKGQAKPLSHLRKGQQIDLKFNDQGDLLQLKLHDRNGKQHIYNKVGKHFEAHSIKKNNPTSRHISRFVVNKSLYQDGIKAGLSPQLLTQLENIYAWEIDFNHSIHKGDKMIVLYEREHLPKGVSKPRHILYARLDQKNNKHFEAIRHVDRHGKSGYYDASGYAMGAAFLKKPVQYKRISSPFNLKRLHPISGKIRPHKGVDMAAATGKPVHATGSGVITFRGRKSGYGNIVEIKHNDRYQTLYAHLSRFNKKFKKGQYVQMNDVIGYVGSSGLATGPHLHYEFHVNGKAVDPMKLKMPRKIKLTEPEAKRFFAKRKQWLAATQFTTIS